MTGHPPNPTFEPSRHSVSGRLHRTRAWVVTVAVLAAACGSTPPSPAVTPAASPTTTPPAALDGLLVAARGTIQVTDQAGLLLAFDPPPGPVVAVSAGSGVVIAVADRGRAWSSAAAGSGARSWKDLGLADTVEPEVRFLALSPSGTTVAVVAGELQGPFELTLLDLAAGTGRSAVIERGLDGVPAWLGDERVAIHVIQLDGESTMAVVETATLRPDDGQRAGDDIAATADGATVAFDDPVTGELVIATRSDWMADRLEGGTRLPAIDGAPVEALALDAAGARLAVVRSSEAGSTVEILTVRDGRWQPARTETIGGDGRVSIAWLR
jgi:hypothetical protein